MSKSSGNTLGTMPRRRQFDDSSGSMAPDWTADTANSDTPFADGALFYLMFDGDGNAFAAPPGALPSQGAASSNAQNSPYTTVAVTRGGITINLEFVTADNPTASFESEVEQAAAMLSTAIHNQITVNITIGYGEVDGELLTNGSAAAGPDLTGGGVFESYATVRTDLIANAAPGDTNFNALPTGSSIGGQSLVVVWTSQQKLFGQLPATYTEIDGGAGFATDISGSLMVGVALQELTHAMGRVPYGPEPDIMEFYRFSSPGVWVFNGGAPGPASYFSVDGGNTKVADYGQNSDPSDFANSNYGTPISPLTAEDPFDQYYDSNTIQRLTTVDLTQLDVLGFNTLAATPPVLSGGGNSVNSTQPRTAVAVDAGLGVSDESSATLAGATAAISAGFLAGDALNFTNQNGIAGTYNATTGVLTLSGSANLAYYQAALESITFSSTSGNSSDSGADPSRTVSWTVTDGTLSSNTITSNINVSTTPVAVNFDDDVGGTPVQTYLLRYGISLSQEQGCTVTVVPYVYRLSTGQPFEITTNATGNMLYELPGGSNTGMSYDLSFARPLSSISFEMVGFKAGNPSGVVVPQWSVTAYDANNHVIGDVGQGLYSSYSNISPQTFAISASSTDPISYVVVHGNGYDLAAYSGPLFDKITLTPIQTPVLSDGGNSVSYGPGSAAVAVDAGLGVAGPATLSGATVAIGAGFFAGDVLNFNSQNGIAGTYNANTGVLTLSGSASLANYQAALESITFSSTSGNPSDWDSDLSRTVSWTVAGGTLSSNPVASTIIIAAPAPSSAPAGTTADMILRDGANGDYVIFDIGNNSILEANALGEVGPEWQLAGLGGFYSTDTTDMMLRDSHNGVFEVYDIANNTITGAASLGEIGSEWQVAGFGDFRGNANETDMILRDSNTGAFEVYDIRNNQITFATGIGQVGSEWTVSGFGNFSGNPNETDMLLRNINTGAFEVYDIANNKITSAAFMGVVGLEWQLAGFGDFSGNPNETDMLMRNTNTGAFEVYDITNNKITSAASMGQVGFEWTVAGFGDFSGNPNESDMLLRNTNTGAFEGYDISHNAITSAASMGQVGLAWQAAGIAADSPAASVGSSSASIAQLAQAMASFGASAAVNSAPGAVFDDAGTSQQTLVTMPQQT